MDDGGGKDIAFSLHEARLSAEKDIRSLGRVADPSRTNRFVIARPSLSVGSSANE